MTDEFIRAGDDPILGWLSTALGTNQGSAVVPYALPDEAYGASATDVPISAGAEMHGGGQHEDAPNPDIGPMVAPPSDGTGSFMPSMTSEEFCQLAALVAIGGLTSVPPETFIIAGAQIGPLGITVGTGVAFASEALQASPAAADLVTAGLERMCNAGVDIGNAVSESGISFDFGTTDTSGAMNGGSGDGGGWGDSGGGSAGDGSWGSDAGGGGSWDGGSWDGGAGGDGGPSSGWDSSWDTGTGASDSWSGDGGGFSGAGASSSWDSGSGSSSDSGSGSFDSWTNDTSYDGGASSSWDSNSDFSGGGGQSSGAGASGSWDSGPSGGSSNSSGTDGD